MSIMMIGIDHHKANVEHRELFAFTRSKCAQAMVEYKLYPGILGCIIISTCNRTEVWASADDESPVDLYQILCSIKDVEAEDYLDLFVCRTDYEAVNHLFSLTCGLDSKILGEDQIISQVKDALALARENYCTDNVLEVLFRMAVTAAKKVKTNVVMSRADISVIHYMVDMLKNKGFKVSGSRCMVIGNGEMGKLAATVLTQEGAHVTVTVRQYKSGMVKIPQGCSRIDYGDRMSIFREMDLIVSATASPNYTIKTVDVGDYMPVKPMVLVDLAVPRDVETQVKYIPDITLYDIDDFAFDSDSSQQKESVRQARIILDEQIQEFLQWYECRDMIPYIQDISACAVGDLKARLHKNINRLPLENQTKDHLEQNIESAAAKTVLKMIYGLRDTVSQETFRECISGLNKLYSSESEGI